MAVGLGRGGAAASAEYDSCLGVEGGMLRVYMQGRQMDDAEAERWCAWARDVVPGYVVKNRLNTHHSEKFLEAREVNFSSNSLGDKGVHALLRALYSLKIGVRVLKLFKNNLGRAAASALMDWLVHTPVPLQELHLSHNFIPREGAVDILKAVAFNPAYPIERSGQRRVPLWLRLEHNVVAAPDELIQTAERQMRKIRENNGGFFTTGQMLCYVSPGTPGKECRSDWCKLSSPGPDGHCPLAQVTYLANQRAPGLKPPPEALCWNGNREQKEEANRWRMANFAAPQPSMAQPAAADPGRSSSRPEAKPPPPGFKVPDPYSCKRASAAAEFKAAPPGFEGIPGKQAAPGFEPAAAIKAPPAASFVPDDGGGSVSALSRAMRETTIKGAPTAKPQPEAPRAEAKLAPALLTPARGPPAKAPPPFAKEPPMLGGCPGPLDIDMPGKSPPGPASFGLGLAHSLTPPAGPASQAGEPAAQGPGPSKASEFKAPPAAIFKGPPVLKAPPAVKAAPGPGAAGVLRVLTRPCPDSSPGEVRGQPPAERPEPPHASPELARPQEPLAEPAALAPVPAGGAPFLAEPAPAAVGVGVVAKGPLPGPALLAPEAFREPEPSGPPGGARRHLLGMPPSMPAPAAPASPQPQAMPEALSDTLISVEALRPPGARTLIEGPPPEPVPAAPWTRGESPEALEGEMLAVPIGRTRPMRSGDPGAPPAGAPPVAPLAFAAAPLAARLPPGLEPLAAPGPLAGGLAGSGAVDDAEVVPKPDVEGPPSQAAEAAAPVAPDSPAAPHGLGDQAAGAEGDKEADQAPLESEVSSGSEEVGVPAAAGAPLASAGPKEPPEEAAADGAEEAAEGEEVAEEGTAGEEAASGSEEPASSGEADGAAAEESGTPVVSPDAVAAATPGAWLDDVAGARREPIDLEEEHTVERLKDEIRWHRRQIEELKSALERRQLT